jgi:hypothetical protein
MRFGVILGVLAGSSVYHFSLYFRDTPITWFEAANFLVFAAMAVACRPMLLSGSVARKVALGFVVILAASQVLVGLRYINGHFLPYLTALNRAQEQAAVALAPYHDRVAFLEPDNSYRPLTIDSGIFKGGSNILEGPQFARSALVRAMFPHRWYFTESPAYYSSAPIDLRSFGAVVFVVRKGLDPGPQAQLALMRAHYGAGLSGLTLRDNIDFGSQEFLVWSVDGQGMTTP